MKAFRIAEEQIAAVAAALINDELAANFGRHVDTQASSAWSAETPLGDGGAELSDEEAAACLARLRQFFGCDEAVPRDAATIGDWAAFVADALARRLGQFTFLAAGGDRREHVHRADAIFADAASVANLLYGRRRILSLVAPHGLIGFVLSVLTPNLLQTPTLDVRKMTPDELNEALSFGDALVATPSLFRYVIAQGVTAPDNAMAVSFGEPMTAELSAEIRRVGFGAQREIYGSTETGIVAWRDAPSEPFALFEQVRRHGDDLRRVRPSGDLSPLPPMDFLIWDGERRFRLGGRRDGAVQIGAVNVFPSRIAARIAEHPLVESCDVTLSRHAAGADRLVAMIKLKNHGPPSESAARAIDNWCRTKLRPYERPRVYNFSEKSRG